MTVRDLTTSQHTPAALRRAVLRHRSVEARDLLATAATAGAGGGGLRALRQSSEFPEGLAWEWAVALASVLALQPATDGDQELARRLYTQAPPEAMDRDAWSTYARLLAAAGDRGALTTLLRKRRDQVTDADALLANLVNPALPWAGGEGSTWSARLSKVLGARGLSATTVTPGPGLPFDRLSARGDARAARGPLVTVVMTTYRPGPNLLTSLRSVVAQTWANLQIIVVDDASGPDHDAVLAEAAALDDRVELVRLARNGGTYGARNAALERARGEFVTGHDDDDWAHPSRVERQVEPLLADPALAATLSRAVWASDELEIASLGWPAVGNYAPSYMVRREVLERAGRYLPARKAADTELIRRVTALTGTGPRVLRDALTVYRTRAGSLSRADFLPGWDHPARVAFWELAADVHERIAAGQLDPRQTAEHVCVPHRFRIDRDPRGPFDVLVVADWRSAPGRGPSGFVTEVEVLADAGMRVGVVQNEDLRAAGARRGMADVQLRRLVNSGAVELVTFDEPVHARLALVRSAGALMYAPDDVAVTVDRVVVVADQHPGDDPTDVTSIDLHRCDAAVTATFGHSPVWVAEDTSLLAPLTAAGTALDGRVHAEPYRGTAPSRLFALRRPRRLVGAPVVGGVVSGRHDLPEDEGAAALVLPRRFDVRVLAPSTLVDGRPRSRWLCFPPEETDLVDYYAQVDVVVRFPHGSAGLGVDVAHALAAGCVVVVPERFRDALGDAAVYAAPDDVAARVDALVTDPRTYRAQVVRARAYALEHLTGTAFVGRLRRIAGIEGVVAGTPA